MYTCDSSLEWLCECSFFLEWKIISLCILLIVYLIFLIHNLVCLFTIQSQSHYCNPSLNQRAGVKEVGNSLVSPLGRGHTPIPDEVSYTTNQALVPCNPFSIRQLPVASFTHNNLLKAKRPDP